MVRRNKRNKEKCELTILQGKPMNKLGSTIKIKIRFKEWNYFIKKKSGIMFNRSHSSFRIKLLQGKSMKKLRSTIK